MPSRVLVVTVSIALLALALAGCDDSDPAIVLDAPVVMTGTWGVEVRETFDSCDDVVGAALPLVVEISEDPGGYHVQITDEDADACWVWIFTGEDEVISGPLVGGTQVSHPCNDGCKIRFESTLTFDVRPGGHFVGTEVVTFEPLTPECDVAACSFPCDPAPDHPFMLGRTRCAFECEVRYRWEADIGAPEPAACRAATARR